MIGKAVFRLSLWLLFGSLPAPLSAVTLSDLRKLIESQAFDSTEDANAYVQQLLRENQGQIPHVAPDTPLEQAMEVI